MNRPFRTSARLASSLVLVLAALAPRAALAQEAATPPPPKPTIPAETVKANTATKGSTELAKGGFVTGALPDADDPSDATEASISAGGLFSSGNARQVALTSIGKLRLRRNEHQLTLSATANFARARANAQTPVATTVENYQGLERYDFFFSDNFAVFLQSTQRHDPFQRLDLRLNIDPGFAYYVINTKKQVLRTEVGYDLQHDVRRRRPAPGQPDDPVGTTFDRTQTLHNARLFVGYENRLYEQVSFITGLEYLQNVSDLDTYRLIFDVGLKSNISDKLAIATTYTMRYENRPLPNVESADSIASVNLVYTLF